MSKSLSLPYGGQSKFNNAYEVTDGRSSESSKYLLMMCRSGAPLRHRGLLGPLGSVGKFVKVPSLSGLGSNELLQFLGATLSRCHGGNGPLCGGGRRRRRAAFAAEKGVTFDWTRRRNSERMLFICVSNLFQARRRCPSSAQTIES